MIKKILTAAVIAAMSIGIASAVPSNEAKLYYNQGVDYYRDGQFNESINAFKQAISIDSNYIDAYYNLGVVLQKMNKNAEALSVFKQIIVRQPSDYESIYNAAALSVQLGQIENAKKYLALIPETSSTAVKAQALASSMNTDLKTIATELAAAAESNVTKVPQTNGVYSNIPSPTGVTTDNAGNLYVASFSNNSITKITPSGAKSEFVKSNQLNGPIDIASDSAGNIYVANYNLDNVVKITQSGTITVLLNNIKKPYCLHIDGDVLFISSQGSNTVIRHHL